MNFKKTRIKDQPSKKNFCTECTTKVVEKQIRKNTKDGQKIFSDIIKEMEMNTVPKRSGYIDLIENQQAQINTLKICVKYLAIIQSLLAISVIILFLFSNQ